MKNTKLIEACRAIIDQSSNQGCLSGFSSCIISMSAIEQLRSTLEELELTTENDQNTISDRVNNIEASLKNIILRLDTHRDVGLRLGRRIENIESDIQNIKTQLIGHLAEASNHTTASNTMPSTADIVSTAGENDSVADKIVAELWDGHCSHGQEWKADCQRCLKYEIIKYMSHPQSLHAPLLVLRELVEALRYAASQLRWHGEVEAGQSIESVLAKIEKLDKVEVPISIALQAVASDVALLYEIGDGTRLCDSTGAERQVVAAFLRRLVEILY